MIEVVRPGPMTTVQDLGRPGLGALGVSRSGAADRAALRLANRLVGNPESAACLEVTFGGLALRFPATHTVALTGAACPLSSSGGRVGMLGPVSVGAGEELALGRPARGLRTYLAVRGGIDVPPVLGSRATDVLAGLGPPALVVGQRLPVGDAVTGEPCVDTAPVPPDPEEPVLGVLPGPRDDWFVAEALTALTGGAYEATPQSNRVGLRLAGPVLRRAVERELPSEGMVRGALQVPPDGQPVLLLADHPVTGGYPVVAVVDEPDVDLAAQVRPGQRLRFRLRTAAAAWT